MPRTALPAAITVPRIAGRLRAADIGLVINSNDPYSVEVGAFYAAARGLAPEQVLRVALPTRATLTRAEFEPLQRAIAAHFGRRTQALALSWVAPHAVECNSITGALALGFDAELCRNSCARSRPSPYFNAATARPFADHGLRPSMLLAAAGVAQARELIERGVAADGALVRRGRPPVSAMLLSSSDAARRVRMALYPQPSLLRDVGVAVRVEPEAELYQASHVLLALTGSVRAPLEPPPDWVAGGLGDHLTSFGGSLADSHGQGTALDWIASGATASHGSVSEPCNHLQKFPHPQVLLLHYLQGATALEAYWKSVAWPQQSLFIGEPLAAPFARQ
ncbi:TIGR03790 family protein [Rubrivivax sp. A210]|uniref:TIGR03790 family protein n=1 Tax=Rubrivivax sp. A210 TaxID=2772301 RepID=UPI001919C62F|nr:TIGR03790 family protein [Rubrivivax sp. A210]